jgi:hypothetical protein
MNKNFIKRPFSFLKKEGFYIILFICLCVAATAAYLTAKNTRNQAEQKNRAAISQSQNKSKDTAKLEDKYDNALQVKKVVKQKVEQMLILKSKNLQKECQIQLVRLFKSQ